MFFKKGTTAAKTIQTLAWTVVSTALVALLSAISQQPELFNPGTVAFANVALVMVKNLLDPKVENI